MQPVPPPNLDALQERLGYQFKNSSLLTLALTHPSAIERTSLSGHNQRLEFLGDAVLQLILSEELYHRFPGVNEGGLSKGRALLVNEATLAERAVQIDLGASLILNRSEDRNGARKRTSILADAFEAVLGAAFLDSGYSGVKPLIIRHFEPLLHQATLTPGIENPKGELQERLQRSNLEGPRYQTDAEAGPPHDRVFECSAWHAGVELGRGSGKSKQNAEVQAAIAALQNLEAHILRLKTAESSESLPPALT